MNLWILSEERPKPEVIKIILNLYLKETASKGEIKDLSIIPIFQDKKFKSSYLVVGFDIDGIDKIFVRIVSGRGSFVDYLVFAGYDEPSADDVPVLVVEETKTADKESRNTGVFQRLSKFVVADMYYPSAKKVMLYNLLVEENVTPTPTNIFGSRILKTLGVEVIGKNFPEVEPFKSVDELIKDKAAMKPPPKGNVPITISKEDDDLIRLTGRLFKSGGLSHDPNIGALSAIAKAIRNLGWEGKIVISRHGLEQHHLSGGNKFLLISNKLGIELEPLIIPLVEMPSDYWEYEKSSEKLASILLHMLALLDKNLDVIYENHAGCERGYLFTLEGNPLVVMKYVLSDKSKGIISLPDIIIVNQAKKQILNLEGKKSEKIKDAIKDLENYGAIEEAYLKPNYSEYSIVRGVVLYGSDKPNPEVMFVLSPDGSVYLDEKNDTLILISRVIERVDNKYIR